MKKKQLLKQYKVIPKNGIFVVMIPDKEIIYKIDMWGETAYNLIELFILVHLAIWLLNTWCYLPSNI